MRGIYIVFAALAWAACTPPAPPPDSSAPRVVSLDYCADQYVLRFVPREQIAGLSIYARAEYSYMKADAKGLPQIRPRSEDILLARPTLVVRSYGGGPHISAPLQRAGVEIVQLGYPANFEDIRKETLRVSAALGQAEAGRILVAKMDHQLSSANQAEAVTALYITPGGVAAGRGTLVDAMITAAGFENAETRTGWVSLPLEQLAFETPDLFVLGFYDTDYAAGAPWSAARHPVMKKAIADSPHVTLNSAFTSCGAWYLADAAQSLAQARP